MGSGLIIRVFCADGPCEGAGPQYLQADTGRILFNRGPGIAGSVYRIDASSSNSAMPRANFVGFTGNAESAKTG